MRKRILFFLFLPFLVSCYSLSIHKKNFLSKTDDVKIDSFYLQAQADNFYLKAEELSSQSQFFSAIDMLKQALVYDPNSFYIHIRLIKEYIKSGLVLEAFKHNKNLLVKNPHNLKLHLQIATIYEKNLLYDLALEQYRQVLKVNPDNADALYKSALLYIKKKDSALVQNWLNQFGDKIPKENLHLIYYFLAQLQKEQGDITLSLFNFQKALFFKPDFISAAVEIFYLNYHLGHLSQSLATLQEFHKTAGYFPTTLILIVQFYIQEQNWDKAIEHLKVLISNSKDPLLQLKMAWLLRQKKSYNKALALVKDLVNTVGSAELYNFYVECLMEKQSFPAALNVSLSALKKFPNYVPLLYSVGQLYDRLGNTKLAVEYMEEVLSIDKEHAFALNHLAFTYAEQNHNLALAEDMVMKALKLRPKDSYIMDTAGWVFFKRGKVKLALKYLEKAYHYNNSEVLIAEHLAEVYYHLNMIQKSLSLYRRAIGLEKNENRRKQLQKKMLSI